MTVLRTERLLARPITQEDLSCLTAIHSDPEIAKTLGGTRTKVQIEKSLAHFVKEWEEKDFGAFLFFTPDEDLVGRAGLRLLEIDGEPVVELMYALMSKYWNQSYGTEMARACIQDAFSRVGLKELVCFTLHENIASRRIMEKLGFVYEKEITHANLPHVFYRLRAQDCTC